MAGAEIGNWSKKQPMIAPLAKFLDWSAAQAACLMMPAEAENLKLEEALRFLKGPNFVPTDNQTTEIEFNGPHDFRFPTPRPCHSAENNVVHGRLYRCGERWRERPVVILLHGSGDSLTYDFRFPAIARRCHQTGFNAAGLVAPYHFQRRPRQMGGSLGYPDYLQLAEATAQAIAEIRALTGWLLAQGCPSVALWGYSMGAWYAGMAVCQDARLAAVVLGATCVRMNPWMEERAVWPSMRQRLPRIRAACEALNLTATNLTVTRPVIPAKNILLLEAFHDSMICPQKDTEELWQSWGQTEIWRLRHGHVGICCGLVPGLNRRVLDWLTPRLEVDEKRNA
jgi:pimeloyl-ACP methyl ester carboxylesterase